MSLRTVTASLDFQKQV